MNHLKNTNFFDCICQNICYSIVTIILKVRCYEQRKHNSVNQARFYEPERGSMSIRLNLSVSHEVMTANSHYYRTPTEERYIDRTLPYHDLIYIVEGDWAIAEAEEVYHLKKGDVLLLSAGRHHYARQPCQAGTRTLCMHISCPESDFDILANSIELPTLLHIGGEHIIRHYFEQIVDIYWSNQSYKNERLETLLRLLLLELAAVQSKQKNPQDTLADQAISLITSDPHRRITTEEAAKRLYVSTKTLTNAMRQKTGMPFYAYQKNIKLEMIAAQLVTETDLRISEIANAFGFNDEFHLSNAFKKKYGVSPQKYRQINLPQN